MSRLIFYLIILGVIYWVVKRALFPPKRENTRFKDAAEEMVQDPVCHCYIAKSQAYSVSLRGEKVFFCSEECYQKYRAANVLPKT